MNNSAPFGVDNFDLADKGRTAVERRLPQKQTTQLRPIVVRRKIQNSLFPNIQQQECLNCRLIDFCKLLDGAINGSDGEPHSTLYDAIRNRDCPFCQHLSQFAFKAFGPLETRYQKELFCTLHLEYAWIGHGRIERKELHTEPRLKVRIQHKCSKSTGCPLVDIPTKEFMLDRDRTNLDPKIDTIPNALCRKSLDYKFDAHQLYSWLERSKDAPSKKVISSIRPLLQQGRLRVIDVWTNEVVTLRTELHYVALSYVWGKSQDSYLSLGHSTVEKRDSFTGIIQTSSLDLKALPICVYDAMVLVKSINQRYLWVDRLCIHQKDDEDRAAIVPEMGAIYGNAYVTIIATDGENANSRISRLAGKDHPEVPISFMSNGKPVVLLPALPGMEDAMKITEWSKRGWTLQERLLSRRCVIFTRTGVFFESETFSESEAYGIRPGASNVSASNIPTSTQDDGESIYNRFLHTTQWNLETYSYAVREYTSRNLTCDGDRLDAFMGIMRQRSPPDLPLYRLKALSGLPINAFVQSLFWSPKDPQQKLTRLPIDTRRSRRLPSWSWVGWKGAVQISTEWRDVAALKVDIIDAANIVCNTYNHRVHFEPILYKVMAQLQVVLHLVADTWPCTVEIRRHGSELKYLVKTDYDWKRSSDEHLTVESTPDAIVPELGDDYQNLRQKARPLFKPKVEPTWPEISRPEEFTADSTFELIALPSVSSQLIVIQHFKEFAERIGWVPNRNIVGDLKPEQKYIRLG